MSQTGTSFMTACLLLLPDKPLVRPVKGHQLLRLIFTLVHPALSIYIEQNISKLLKGYNLL